MERTYFSNQKFSCLYTFLRDSLCKKKKKIHRETIERFTWINTSSRVYVTFAKLHAWNERSSVDERKGHSIELWTILFRHIHVNSPSFSTVTSLSPRVVRVFPFIRANLSKNETQKSLLPLRFLSIRFSPLCEMRSTSGRGYPDKDYPNVFQPDRDTNTILSRILF